MKRMRFFTVVSVFAILLSITGAVAAGTPFAGVTNTASGYTTWDSDMIDVEQVTQTGQGVYVAVLDTGLAPNWTDYFPKARIATKLGIGFEQPVTFKQNLENPCEVDTYKGQLRKTTYVGSRGSTHGTHVTSTILGYFYRSNSDAAAGYPLPPIMVRGIAPEVTIIPVKVLADYQIPALPKCGEGIPSQGVVFGTDEMVAAGINYVTSLAKKGYKPIVINMSLGGPELVPIEQEAIDKAIEAGVIVVASAGNEGEAGMGYPGAYAPVISAGSVGWTKEWLLPVTELPRYRLWWLQSGYYPFIDIPENTPLEEVYVSDFSSRQLAGQELDVLAPGSWVRGPFAGDPGYSHLPWWSGGIGDLMGHNPGNFYYVGGTSMSAPHVTSLAAMMLQKDATLTQSQVELIMRDTAMPIPAGSRDIWDNTVPATMTWGDDATGAGLIQVDAALAAVP